MIELWSVKYAYVVLQKNNLNISVERHSNWYIQKTKFYIESINYTIMYQVMFH